GSSIQLWNTSPWSKRAGIHHGGKVHEIAVAPGSGWLASRCDDGEVRLWDASAGEHLASLRHDGEVQAFAIAPDGTVLARASNRTLRVWDVATGLAVALMRVENPVLACAWAGEGAIASGGHAGLYTFDFLTRAAASSPPPGSPQPREISLRLPKPST